MKLSISNIAWSKENDEEMYQYLSNKVDAIEIAPTRIIEENPYEHIEEMKQYVKRLEEKYNLKISSMQSIWFGKQEKIFESQEEREELVNYSKKAIDFANAINCKNLVFGCPRNRVVNNVEEEKDIAKEFFGEIGDYAKQNNTCFAIEANPPIYNTNYINKTQDAIELAKELNNEGIKINLDFGTIIENKESLDILKQNVPLINHVHISEPNLEYIQKREEHKELISILKQNNYTGYISVEMKNQNDIEKVKETVNYLIEIVKGVE